jgi:hypothetical protein
MLLLNDISATMDAWLKFCLPSTSVLIVFEESDGQLTVKANIRPSSRTEGVDVDFLKRLVVCTNV